MLQQFFYFNNEKQQSSDIHVNHNFITIFENDIYFDVTEYIMCNYNIVNGSNNYFYHSSQMNKNDDAEYRSDIFEIKNI